MMQSDNDNMKETIVAQATATGRGGVGILRISGKNVRQVAKEVLGHLPKPRYAEYLPFLDENGNQLDQGLALFFPEPNSFTGEDVLELQGHGGPVLLDLILKRILLIPEVRIARPGEFSERAFLNDKIDLTQAEAIADLIDASSEQAAKSAMRSLQGEFSKKINDLVQALIQLRVFVEAAIDFPEEEIDFLSDGKVDSQLIQIQSQLKSVQKEANQGALLREGMKIVIAGRPNAGKSSLLNQLSGKESAIVTEIEGTTRDVLKEHIHIDGIPLHLIDTAGLRKTNDIVEQIGIKRALDEIQQADRLLLMVDSTETTETDPKKLWLNELTTSLPSHLPITVIRNKADLTHEELGLEHSDGYDVIRLSAKTGEGIEILKQHLKEEMGLIQYSEGGFLARRRHLDSLNKAEQALKNGYMQLTLFKAGELLAEDLRLAQEALSEITGTFTSDDLLGQIFGSFCIGK